MAKTVYCEECLLLIACIKCPEKPPCRIASESDIDLYREGLNKASGKIKILEMTLNTVHADNKKLIAELEKLNIKKVKGGK